MAETWEEIVARLEREPEPSGEVRSDWQPIDLAPLLRGEMLDPPPTILRRTDDQALFYLAKTNGLSGEPEAAKGWIVLAGAKELMDLDEFVLYLDFEDAAPGIVGRLRALGATDDQIRNQFVYVRPDTAASADTVSNLPGIGASLIVIDGVTEAMSLQGLNPNDNQDVATFIHLLPQPLAKMGAAVVLIDHVTKDRNGRGRGPIGAQHKLAGIDGAAYAVEMIRPFGRGMSGLSRLKVEKDRPGYIRPRSLFAKVAADVFLESSADDGSVRVRLEPAEGSEDGDGGFRPTYYMEKVSRYLELAGEQTVSGIATSVEGKREWVMKAAHQLVADGYATRRDGPRNAVLLSSTKAYRQADDA
jgi:AAA domain